MILIKIFPDNVKERIFMILKAFWCYESVFWRTFWDVERLQCTYLQRSKIANIRNLMQPACTLHFLLIAKISGLFRAQDAQFKLLGCIDDSSRSLQSRRRSAAAPVVCTTAVKKYISLLWYGHTLPDRMNRVSRKRSGKIYRMEFFW